MIFISFDWKWKIGILFGGGWGLMVSDFKFQNHIKWEELFSFCFPLHHISQCYLFHLLWLIAASILTLCFMLQISSFRPHFKEIIVWVWGWERHLVCWCCNFWLGQWWCMWKGKDLSVMVELLICDYAVTSLTCGISLM